MQFDHRIRTQHPRPRSANEAIYGMDEPQPKRFDFDPSAELSDGEFEAMVTEYKRMVEFNFGQTRALAAGVRPAAMKQYLRILFPHRQHELTLLPKQQQWVDEVLDSTPQDWGMLNNDLTQELIFVFPANHHHTWSAQELHARVELFEQSLRQQTHFNPTFSRILVTHSILNGADPSAFHIPESLWNEWKATFEDARAHKQWTNVAQIGASLALIAADHVEVTDDNQIRLVKSQAQLGSRTPVPPRSRFK